MKDKSSSDRFLFRPGQTVSLAEFDPPNRRSHKDKAAAREETAHYARRLRELQHLLNPEGRRWLLICLPAQDAGGNGGTIRHVQGYMNPQRCRVRAFKQPWSEEADHDFLWRASRAPPRLGEVGILNRSHYEEVPVARVHELALEQVWRARFGAINAFERHLGANGTHILKCYLYLSQEEQRKRFRRRIDEPARWWKISESDDKERQFWPAYRTAYAQALSRCSTREAPWYAIPSDH